ncbi:hypothetical protein BDD12DRAFT_881949 [Trichophaea hybrida]|nr:hypothetical protein BDD12DRAFT_881949 [Trichophaea hybrida]
MAKKKKAPPSNPLRGFSTTSIPSKPKAVVAESPPAPSPPADPEPSPPPPESWKPPVESELADLVTKEGPKVRRESARIVAKSETDKRTLRGTCYPLRVERALSFTLEGKEETVGGKILRLARTEYEKGSRVRDGDCDLTTAWMVKRVLLGLGFEEKQVDRAIKGVMTRLGGVKDVEALVEECLEWGAMFWEDDAGRFGEVRKVKGSTSMTPASTGTTTPVAREGRTAGADVRYGVAPSPVLKPTIRHVSLISEISNLELETKDISDRGSDPAVFEDFPEDEGEDEEEDEEEEESDEELTPENLVPTYLALQTNLYNIHPNCASTIVGGKRAKGGGKKPTKSAPQSPPKSLSDKSRATVKRLQQKLAELERDPLFDSYIADTVWRDERARLDEEAWANKKSKPPPPPRPVVKNEPKPLSPPPPEDEGLIGSLLMALQRKSRGKRARTSLYGTLRRRRLRLQQMHL